MLETAASRLCALPQFLAWEAGWPINSGQAGKSSHRDATVEAGLQRDWTYLVKALKITASPNYLRHDGKPVLAFRGFGDGTQPPEDPQKALRTQNWFKHNPDPDLRATIMGTIRSRWRTLGSDSRAASMWLEVYHNFDIKTASRRSRPGGTGIG